MIYLLSYLLIFFSLLVAFLNNAVNALFSLASCYFISAILLLVLNLEFLALILVIVYLGALLMLFLFILMLSNVKEVYTENSGLLNQILILFNFYLIFSLFFFITKFLNLTFLNSFNLIYNFEHYYMFITFFKYDIDCFIFLYTDFFV